MVLVSKLVGPDFFQTGNIPFQTQLSAYFLSAYLLSAVTTSDNFFLLFAFHIIFAFNALIYFCPL